MIFWIVGGAVVAAGLGSGLFRSRRSANRVTTTADTRRDTKADLTDMSNLILDLEPRIAIANDAALRHKFAEASNTYSQVLMQADNAKTGHEIADLRLAIAKSRWQLDVIDAELEGNEPPAEPFTRNTDGTAWDATRGTGADHRGSSPPPVG